MAVKPSSEFSVTLRAERLPVADGIGASGGTGRRRSAATRTQSGSRHLAGGDACEEADCEEKEAGCGSGPSGSIAAGGGTSPTVAPAPGSAEAAPSATNYPWPSR